MGFNTVHGVAESDTTEQAGTHGSSLSMPWCFYLVLNLVLSQVQGYLAG